MTVDMLHFFKKILSCSKGSETVEFVVCFWFVAFAFMLIVSLSVMAVRNEILSYAAYAGSRSLKVYGEVEKAVKQVVPEPRDVSIEMEDQSGQLIGFVSVKVGPPDSMASSPAVMEVSTRKDCEDNPLWNISGEESCK